MRDVAPFDTPRMHARPLGPGDEALYCALYTDPAVMALVGPALSPGDARRGFAVACRCNADDGPVGKRWAILDRGTGEAIGLLALVPDGSAGAEFGVMLMPSAQGRGLARELNDAVVAMAFSPEGWGLRRLWARHAPGHAAAAAALAASGFRPGPRLGVDATVEITRSQA